MDLQMEMDKSVVMEDVEIVDLIENVNAIHWAQYVVVMEPVTEM